MFHMYSVCTVQSPCYIRTCQEFNTALHLAVELANLEMVQALLTIPDINLRILNKVGIVVYTCTYVHLIIHRYKFSRLGDLLHLFVAATQTCSAYCNYRVLPSKVLQCACRKDLYVQEHLKAAEVAKKRGLHSIFTLLGRYIQ